MSGRRPGPVFVRQPGLARTALGQDPAYGFKQPFQDHGFGHMGVHSTGKAYFLMLRESMGRDADYRKPRENLFDVFIGAIAGSILAGNPITSYILGGEFLKQGVGIIAVTAFLVAWVTVGIIQYPMEASIFGKKFALIRNFLAFFSSLIIGIIMWLVL